MFIFQIDLYVDPSPLPAVVSLLLQISSPGVEVSWDGNMTLGVAFQDATTASSAFTWVVGQIQSSVPWLVVQVRHELGLTMGHLGAYEHQHDPHLGQG